MRAYFGLMFTKEGTADENVKKLRSSKEIKVSSVSFPSTADYSATKSG